VISSPCPSVLVFQLFNYPACFDTLYTVNLDRDLLFSHCYEPYRVTARMASLHRQYPTRSRLQHHSRLSSDFVTSAKKDAGYSATDRTERHHNRQPETPPSSPNQLLSAPFIIGDPEELSQADGDMNSHTGILSHYFGLIDEFYQNPSTPSKGDIIDAESGVMADRRPSQDDRQHLNRPETFLLRPSPTDPERFQAKFQDTLPHSRSNNSSFSSIDSSDSLIQPNSISSFDSMTSRSTTPRPLQIRPKQTQASAESPVFNTPMYSSVVSPKPRQVMSSKRLEIPASPGSKVLISPTKVSSTLASRRAGSLPDPDVIAQARINSLVISEPRTDLSSTIEQGSLSEQFRFVAGRRPPTAPAPSPRPVSYAAHTAPKTPLTIASTFSPTATPASANEVSAFDDDSDDESSRPLRKLKKVASRVNLSRPSASRSATEVPVPPKHRASIGTIARTNASLPSSPLQQSFHVNHVHHVKHDSVTTTNTNSNASRTSHSTTADRETIPLSQPSHRARAASKSSMKTSSSFAPQKAGFGPRFRSIFRGPFSCTSKPGGKNKNKINRSDKRVTEPLRSPHLDFVEPGDVYRARNFV